MTKTPYFLLKILPALFLLCLSACQNSTAFPQQELATRQFFSRPVQTSAFTLETFRRSFNPEGPLVVYIGDDDYEKKKSWLAPSSVALQLAMRDLRPNVAYLGRPCQHGQTNEICESNIWQSSQTFSEITIANMNDAIDQLKVSPEQQIELIGFSGGAVIAIDIAARRHDVIALRTVAGDLNPKLSGQLPQSADMVDPMEYAARLRNIPQIHYLSARDEIIPNEAARSFHAAAGKSSCITLETVSGTRHYNGWKEKWPGLLKIRPRCR